MGKPDASWGVRERSENTGGGRSDNVDEYQQWEGGQGVVDAMAIVEGPPLCGARAIFHYICKFFAQNFADLDCAAPCLNPLYKSTFKVFAGETDLLSNLKGVLSSSTNLLTKAF